MLTIAKIFATVFGVLVIARSIIDYRTKKESLQMTIFWVAVWAAIVIITYCPNLIEEFIRLTGGERTGMGTVFGMAIVFVLFINYRIYVKANRVEKILGQIVRKISLQEIKNNKRRKNETIAKK